MRPSKRFCGLVIAFISIVSLASAQERVPGRLLVGIDEAARPRAFSALSRLGLKAPRAAVVSVPEEAAEQVAASLRATGLFRYVEPDYYAYTGRTPNDGLFWSQWYLTVIQAEAAWDITTGSSGTVVGIIDSGVDANHPDLAGRLAPGHNFLNGGDDTPDTMGHGTAVAGVVGAAADNDDGVAGLTWRNPVMPLAVVDADGRAEYSDIVAAIRYAADQGVRVVNISLGGTAPSQAMQEAVDYAWGKGTLIVAAAMNQAVTNPYYPGACDHVLAVSAIDVTGGLASFSNYGKWVSLSAPGAMIMSTVRGGGYGYWYGTSFAAPVVTGVAALVVSMNPKLTPSQVADILEQSADDVGARGYDIFFGWGRVSAAKALAAAKASLKPAAAPAPPVAADPDPAAQPAEPGDVPSLQ